MKSVGGKHPEPVGGLEGPSASCEGGAAPSKLGWQVPEDDMSPTLVGAMPLPFPVPDSFETAFGFREIYGSYSSGTQPVPLNLGTATGARFAFGR